MALIAVAGITLAAAFFITFIVMPLLIRKIALRKIMGKDMNKQGAPEVPEMGGIGVILGFSFGVMLAIFAFSYLHLIDLNLTLLLAGFSTIVIVGFLGVIDDLIGWKRGIRQWQHALMPLFAALPLMAIKINNPPIKIPFFGIMPAEYMLPIVGIVSFGVLYSLIIVPIGVTGASNATNMLAGFNGLEAGLAAIMASTLLAIALMRGNVESAIILAAIIGAMLAFLFYNWYPAKIFGGDSLTLISGSTIAAAVIIGNMEKLGILIMVLFFIEFLIKARHKFKSECFGIPQKDGTLKPDPRGGSLTHWIMRRGRFTEKQVTSILLGTQATISVVVFLLFYFRLII